LLHFRSGWWANPLKGIIRGAKRSSRSQGLNNFNEREARGIHAASTRRLAWRSTTVGSCQRGSGLKAALLRSPSHERDTSSNPRAPARETRDANGTRLGCLMIENWIFPGAWTLKVGGFKTTPAKGRRPRRTWRVEFHKSHFQRRAPGHPNGGTSIRDSRELAPPIRCRHPQIVPPDRAHSSGILFILLILSTSSATSDGHEA
jgi:hypothetical protein